MFEAVLLDWAGTTVDFGSCAPARVFREIFHRKGVEITEAEARGPMGLAKWDHIRAVASVPRVAASWQKVHGRVATDDDVQAMYDEFLPLQKLALANGSDVIPGAVEAIAYCRSRGMKIGSTTGYTRELMDVVVPLAAAAGYQPDVVVCSDEVAAGRPAPLMNQRAAEQLGVRDLTKVLVVDDTVVGIEAGVQTSSPTLAFTDSGNAMGLDYATYSSLSDVEVKTHREPIEALFRKAGAAHLLPTIADLPQLIEALQGAN